MEDVNISIYRASVVREGSTPASPGFVVSEGQNPVDPSGSGQNHLPVTITPEATGLSITESQVLGGAGTVGQYIRGDGSLADFPESSGGGSSVSYYLNGSVAQGTIGGVAYKELNKVPILGAGTDFTINANGYIASFITDAGDPNLLEIPAGNWNFETYFSASSNGGSPSFYVELYKVNSGGTATLIASNSTFPELIAFGTNVISYFSTLAVPTTALDLTDRLAIRYYVIHSGRTITLHTEDNHLCQIITTFTTGLTALNGLTAQIQNFAVGTSGTDFAIASATATHTFNLPTASATNRGALSSADWTTFNNKTSNLGTVTSVGLSSATSGVTIGSTPVTTSGTITLAIATASGSQNGLLSSTDWTTFNGKQNALTNPVTGNGSAGQVAYWSSSSGITGDVNLFFDATNDRLGINTASPNEKLEVQDGFLSTYHNINSNGAGYGIQFYTNGGGSKNSLAYIVLSQDGTARTGNLLFGTSNAGAPTDKMALFSDGNLLLTTGPLTNAGYKLQVNGGNGNQLLLNTTSQYCGISIANSSSVKGGVSWDNTNSIFALYTNGSIPLSLETNNLPRLTITGGGNVGIGTVNPSARLHVANSAGGVVAFFQSTATNGEAQIDLEGRNSSGTVRSAVFKYDNSDIFRIGTSSNIAMRFETNDGETMRLFSSRNVHIGPTPASDNGARLQVSGTGRFGSDSVEGNVIIRSNTTPLLVQGLNPYQAAGLVLTWDVSPNAGLIVSNVLKFYTNASIGSTIGSLALTIGTNQAATFSSSVTTGAPAGGTAQPWKLGTVATVSPTSPNRTIEVEVNGTTYYLHAKTTNN